MASRTGHHRAHRAHRAPGVLRAAPWVAAAAACALAACGAPEPEPELPRTIRAAYSQEPPYAFLDAEARVTGESPEVLRAVAEELGIEEIRWIRMDFDELIPSLLDGRVDVVSAGMFVTSPRSDRVRFSRATLCTQPAFVVRREGAASDPSSADPARIAIVAGTVEADAARNLNLPEERLLTVYDIRTGIIAVRSGEADALAVTLPTAQSIVEADTAGDLRVIGPYEPPPGAESLAGCSALAFRPADESLARAADCVLAGFIGSDAHLALIGRFGFDEDALPDPVEEPAACAEGP